MGGGVPHDGGSPQPGMGYSLGQVRTGGRGYLPPARSEGVGGNPPPQYRTADGVLDTPRSVCLLRSRRTFLLLVVNGVHLEGRMASVHVLVRSVCEGHD